MLVIRLTHVSHTRQLSSDNSGQPVALVSTLTLITPRAADLRVALRQVLADGDFVADESALGRGTAHGSGADDGARSLL